MRKYLSIFLSIVMLFTVIGTMTVASAETTTYNILDVKDQIRTVGRTTETTSGIKLEWTASGIEFNANCEGDVALTIQASCLDYGNLGDYNKDCYFTVYIDGVRQNYRVRTMDGTYTVNIAEGLSSGDHTFKIVKQNEKSTTSATIQSIALNGTIGEKPADPEYVIEFLGDSITSGWGSLDTNNNASRYSDGTRTYAYIIAENFGAEARVTSNSGDTITGIYSKYTSGYDYSLKKPNLVSIAFGTNDGPQTVEYWYDGIKNLADAIRTGYNDNSIPFMFIHNLILNNDPLRANIVEAINQLKAEDAEKYSNMYVTAGNDPHQGGHPPQASHFIAANKLTRDIVDFGIIPASALRSDATITLTPATAETEVLKNMDTVVTPATTAITGELVDPLDPADAESDTAKAVKYTADGTQSATTTYQYSQVSLGRINNSGFRTNGISFYINYKDTTDYTGVEEPTYSKPKLLISAGDQTSIITLDVKQGVTTKVELYWNTMPKIDYVFLRMLSGNNPLIALEMTGKCEYTIDNVTVLLNKYTYAINENRAYTYTTGYNSYPLMGVTDNYENETTTTTTVATTVPTDGDDETSSFSTSATTPSTLPEGAAKAKIGNTEYASLFGADGALANAQDGDRIVMVADEEYTYTADKRATLSTVSKNITLDLAGHTVSTTTDNASDTDNTLIAAEAPLTIVSTIDGLGKENTATKGVLSAKATVITAKKDFTANNVEIRSSLSGDSYGMALTVISSINVTIKDCVIYAPKHTICVSGSTVTFDVDNCSISAERYSLSSVNGYFTGIIKNSEIIAKSYGPRIMSDDLEFNNCNLYVNDYDQNVIDLRAGNLILANGTIVNCGTKAKFGILLASTASIETSNTTIKSPKNAAGAYALSFSSSETSILGEGTVISASGNARNSNINLYSHVKDGYALYSSATASEDTLIAKDYDYTTYAGSIYVLEELKSTTVTIDGDEVDVVDGKVTLPVTADLYLTDKAVYTAGEEIDVTEDMALTSYELSLTMKSGASIRLNQTNGIRFYTDVNSNVIDKLKEANADVTVGTLITPADLLGNKDLTLDCGVSIANVVYAAELGGKWNGEGFVGSLVNIKESNTYNAQTGNIGRDFVGRGYITVTVGDMTKTVYADYADNDVANNSRSLSYVAHSYKTDADSEYPSLVDTLKELVDRWAKVYTDLLG